MPTIDVSEVAELSFFELDKLFTQAARTLKRKRKKQIQQREQDGLEADSEEELQDEPTNKRALRGAKLAHNFGGFSGHVVKVERTAIAAGCPAGADEKTLFKHFARCGTVIDLQILKNRHDLHTGIVLVEFDHDDSVNRAAALPPPFNEIQGVPTVVKRADLQVIRKGEQPKRMMTREQFTKQVLQGLKASPDDLSGPNMRKLHIQNLRPVVTDEDMRGIFKPFGEFDTFEMGSQECWITFKTNSDANDAMSSMQGFQLVGQELKISLHAGPAQIPSMSKAGLPPPPPNLDLDLKGDSDFGATGTGGALQNRVQLMKKLMSSHQAGGIPTVVGNKAPSSGPAPPPPPGAPPPGSVAAMPPAPKPGGPTARTLLLQNMFSPLSVDLAKEPNFYNELREDTHEECSNFGKVVHVTVDPRGATGLIYILFEAAQMRSAAEMSLNGRWFEGKKILAEGIDDSIWQALAAQASQQG